MVYNITSKSKEEKNIQNANAGCVFEAVSSRNRRGAWKKKSPSKAASRLNSGLSIHKSSVESFFKSNIAHVMAFKVPVPKGDP